MNDFFKQGDLAKFMVADIIKDKLAAAEVETSLALQGFTTLGMKTEERRALRELLRTQLQRQPERRDMAGAMLRLMDLDEAMDRRDRALAGDDFDARMRYTQQEFELQLRALLREPDDDLEDSDRKSVV